MNKKFTFMVAALLAAGSFSASAQDLVSVVDANSSKYYHLVFDNASDGVGVNDAYVKMEVKADGTISYPTTNGIVTAVGDEYLWKVVVTTKGTAKEVTLKNKKTGLEIAVDKNGTLLTNAYQYTSLPTGDIDKTFDYANGLLLNAGFNYLKWESNAVKQDGSTGTQVSLVTPTDASVSVADLIKLGEGINLTFEGTPTGANVFENLTVVDAGAGKFYLVKGKYDASKAFTSSTTYVVLSTTVGVTGQVAPEGCTYITVAGDKLKDLAATAEVKSGEYPKANALFSAIKNVNAEGKIALQQSDVLKAENGKWAVAPETTYYVSASGNTGTPIVNAQSDKEDAAWLTPSLGTAVDVKTLVKGQWIVNILASLDKNSTEMKTVAYSTQASSTVANLTKTAEETAEHKDAIYAQWVVSADKDANTVTFINRETGKTISNVTLFKTPKANVYSVIGGSEISALADRYIELRTVENTTQWDGYLKLDASDLNSTEYTLGVDAGDLFEDVEAKIVASSTNITKSTNKDDNALTFKLVQSKQKVNNVDKLDTMFVNVVKYNYYKDGKLTEAADTLKAIQYNLTGLVNAGDYTKVTDGFKLSKTTTDTDGKFVFRKVGDRYQIAKLNPYYNGQTIVTYSDVVNYFGYASMASTNAAFSLNPIAAAPVFELPESHVAFEINGAYLGVKADGNAIMTNDTSMLKSANVDAAFSFYAFSADKEEAKTPSYYLSSNGKMMYDAIAEVEAIVEELDGLSEVFDAEKIAELEAKKATYFKDGYDTKDQLVKFQQAKYVDAENIALAEDTVKGDALKAYKFNAYDIDGQAVLKNGNGKYVTVLNEAVVLQNNIENAAKFNVVAAEAPTSNESVSASEVAVVAQNGSVVVKNAAGKNVVVSTILGQVVANEVLTSDNATINVPAGIVVVAVEGESFKVNVK